MHKYISTVVFLNEAISLFCTKPFYGSFRQSFDLLSNFFDHGPQAKVVTLAKEKDPSELFRPAEKPDQYPTQA